MVIPNEITLNIAKKTEIAQFSIPQGDNIDRVFYVNLINDADEYIIPLTATVRFGMTKSDGKVIYNNCPVENNKVKLVITPAISAEEGRHPAQFRITDSATGGLLHSFRFHMFIDKSVDIEEAVINTSEFTALQDMELRVGDVSNVIANAENATADAIAATENANNAADLANTKAGLANTATDNAIDATNDAILATENANNARYLGEYINTITYKLNNIVKYQNALYICNAETTGNLPSNTTYWDISSKQFTWKSIYNSLTDYTALDAVSYLGSSYICKQSSTGNIPTNTTYFEPLSLKGEKGAALSPKGTYNAEVTYIKDDLVNYNTSVWQCLQTVTGIEPTEGTNWTIFLTGGGAIGDLSTLKTDIKTTAVDAINEIRDIVGDLSTLKTPSKTDLVSSINDISSQMVNYRNIFISTLDPSSSDGNDGDIWIKYIDVSPYPIDSINISTVTTTGVTITGIKASVPTFWDSDDITATISFDVYIDNNLVPYGNYTWTQLSSGITISGQSWSMGTSHTISVKTKSESGTKTTYSSTVNVIATPLAQVTGLSAQASDNSVGLSWNAVTGAAYYNVKRSTTSGGSYTIIASPTTTNYTDTTATNGTTYYYVVSAIKTVSEGLNSTQVSATPQKIQARWLQFEFLDNISGSGAYMDLWELEVNSPDILPITPESWSASSTFGSGMEADKLADGITDDSHRWVSNGITNQYVKVDIGSLQDITKWRAYTSTNISSNPRNVKVYKSDTSTPSAKSVGITNADWTLVSTVTLNPVSGGGWTPYYNFTI